MKIQCIVTPRSGISYHRIINPLTYLQLPEGDTKELLWIRDDERKIDCDLLIYNKFTALPPYLILEIKERTGMRTMVDIDDHPELPSWHINYTAWNKAGHTQRIIEHMKMADIVTCTSMHLQDKVREYNKNTVVIPNAFPFGYENYIPQPKVHDKMVFMYMGGSTHLPDVKLLEGKFRRINSDPSIKDHAQFVLAGYEAAKKMMIAPDGTEVAQDTRGPYDAMGAIFSQTGSYDILPTANLDEYINYYDQADVALCPLVDTPWNHCKSVLKIIEAGVKGVPVICSKVMPYYPELKDAPGIMWVENNNWLEHIKWCIKNPIAVIDMGKQLTQYCKEHYDLLMWNKTRNLIIDSLR